MNENKTNWSVPIAIVLAGAMIAGAVYLKDGGVPADKQVAAVGNLKKIEKLNSNDHVRGTLKAPLKVVEYSDLECPFCKAFHKAMENVFIKYNGTKIDSLAWIYRHFPLDSIHPKARKEAEAVECANELAGSEGFWNFTDKIFAITPSNDGLDLAQLPVIAGQIGLDVTKFNECLESGKMAEKIEADYQNGLEIGVDGTPTVIVVMEDGKMFMPFKEAVPKDASAEVKALTADIFSIYQTEIEKLRSGN